MSRAELIKTFREANDAQKIATAAIWKVAYMCVSMPDVDVIDTDIASLIGELAQRAKDANRLADDISRAGSCMPLRERSGTICPTSGASHRRAACGRATAGASTCSSRRSAPDASGRSASRAKPAMAPGPTQPTASRDVTSASPSPSMAGRSPREQARRSGHGKRAGARRRGDERRLAGGRSGSARRPRHPANCRTM